MSSLLDITEYSILNGGWVFDYPDGTRDIVPSLINYEITSADRFHLVQPGDTLKALSYKYYADQRQNAAEYWHYIYKANDMDNPFDLSVFIGGNIIIPDIDLFQSRYVKKITVTNA